MVSRKNKPWLYHAGTIFLTLSLLIVARQASGQAGQELERDRERFAEAVELLDGGRYTDALEIFEELQGQRPHSTILYNIAWCLSRLERNEEALSRFNEFLTSDDTSPERRETALQEKERLEELTAESRAESIVGEPSLEGNTEIEHSSFDEAPAAMESTAPEPVTEEPAATESARRRIHPGWFWSTFGLTLSTGSAMAATGAVTLVLSERWMTEGDINDRDRGRTIRTVTDALLITTVVEAIAALLVGFFTDF